MGSGGLLSSPSFMTHQATAEYVSFTRVRPYVHQTK